jgi:ABC-2 type transport system permease protein
MQFGGAILMEPVNDPLYDMLAHYGVTVGQGMVLDPQNEPFPIQVTRNVSGVNVVEIQQMRYPYFVDVRASGMAKNNPIVANLPAVTLQWVSPLEVDPEKNKDREVVELLRSTDASWVRTTNDVQPNPQAYPELGFPVEGEQKSRLLAVSIRGSFESYFKDRPNPFLEAGAKQGQENAGAEEEPDKALGMTTVEKSPESARLVVIGSSEFLDDTVLGISRTLFQDRYLNNLQFLQNAVDWAVEDADLLSIRSRGTQARLLRPLSQGEQSFWEGLNYVVALLGLGVIGLVWNNRRRHEAPMPLVNLHQPDKGQGGES